MQNFVDLNRTFRDLTDKEREDTALLSMWGMREATIGDTWVQLLKANRIVVLAEAGSGKTWELKNQAAKLRAAGERAFFIPIEALEKEDVRGYLAMEEGEVEQFDAWRSDGTTAWFFLDAVDELKLIHGKIETALGKLARALGPARDRARILLSCRPSDWRPVKDMEIFRSKFPTVGPKIQKDVDSDEAFLAPVREVQASNEEGDESSVKDLRCVVLLPLGKDQIGRFAAANGITDPKAFLAEIHRREAWTFARRPLDLKGLIAAWQTNGSLGTLRQQHETDIENSLRDDPDRPDHHVLTLEKAHEGAERLALALLLTKRRAIKSPEQSAGECIDASALDASLILTDWTDSQIQALLRRSIFDPATYGRIRFHHRSIQEFLAARRLIKLRSTGMTKRKLHSLLFADTYGERVVIPSMRPIVAWLSNDDADVCSEVLAREPEVLILCGDPETLPFPVRQKLVRSYVDAYKGGDWRGLQMPVAEAQRLANADLSSEIKSAWKQARHNEETSEFLLKLIWLGAIQDCAEIAAEALMDDQLEPYTRVVAARGLSECQRLDLLRRAADDLLSTPQRWPDRVVHSLAEDLFPDVISTHELELLIRRTREPTRSISGFSWTLYTLMDQLETGSGAGISLRKLLAKMIWEGRNPTSEWHNLDSKYAYLAGALAKLCYRQMDRDAVPSVDLIYASVVASRFHQSRDVIGRDDLEQLRNRLAALKKCRPHAFWFEFDMIMGVKHGDSRSLLFAIQHDGVISSFRADDWTWLLKELKKPRSKEAREVAFYALIDLWHLRGKLSADISKIESAVTNDRVLTETLRTLRVPPKPNTELQALEKRQSEYKAKREAEKNGIEKSWADWKLNADANPSACFRGSQAERSMWILLKWLSLGDGNHPHLGHANWRKVRSVLGDTIGEGFERTLKAYWRKTTPPVWSKRKASERNSIWNSQSAALTGLGVEAAQIADWPKSLSPKEARRAAEWALTELNGAPEWLNALASEYPEEVRGALDAELRAELKKISVLEYPHTLNLLRYGQEQARNLAFPLLAKALLKWPKAPRGSDKRSVYTTNLDSTLAIVITSNEERIEIANECESRFLADPMEIGANIWLQGLCACDLKRGVAALKAALKRVHNQEKRRTAIEWFGCIFGTRDNFRTPISLNADASLLLELTSLVYEYVRREDDIDHGGRAYTPGPRDEAESARNRLLTALVELPGIDAHNALLKLSAAPLFLHIADRLKMLARQRAANDSEIPTLSPSDYRTLEQRYETVPRTRDELFQVMLDRLEDIDHDVKHHDFTDRQTLACIEKELELQPLIAKKFDDARRGQYQVTREEEVADKKATDVRLLANASDQRGVIELKIGDNWSVGQLEAALSDQLVRQYLRHERCTAGCMLVTYAGRKGFENPNTGGPMEFEDVIAQLKKSAQKLETTENGRIRLAVVGLDLRPLTQLAMKFSPLRSTADEPQVAVSKRRSKPRHRIRTSERQ